MTTTISAIETFSGRLFTPLAPIPAEIIIEDIAHALGNQGRFAGHSRFRYSVGEHSVRVSELLERTGHPYVIQLWGLLHDASEAYLVDLPTPLKYGTLMGVEYLKAEKALMRSICFRFALPPEEPEPVRVADAVLLATEVRDLMHPDRPHWKGLKGRPLAERIRPWADGVAESEFLLRYRRLVGL